MRRATLLLATTLLVVAAACRGDHADSSDPTTTLLPTTAATATTAPVTTAPPSTTAAATSPPATTAPANTTPATTAPATPDLGAVSVRLTPIAAVDAPVFLTTRPGDASTLYVGQQTGQIRAVRDGVVDPNPVLDVSSMTAAGGERGFLGFTFSPDGVHLYVDYTDRNGDSHVDEYTVAADGTVDPASQRQVLFQDQPFPNHNGGEVIFGPDGYLYIGFGDGGSGGDPRRNALNLGTWLGKILRIDPRVSGDQPYSVPPDNPFVGQAGAKPEIWSYGLRNPWRFSFDAVTNDLWIGDVGQGDIEEVDRSTVAEGAGNGVNFGWSAFEGRSRYNEDQSPDGVTQPVFQYTHAGGNCSVTGGYIYRGSAIPALRGAYIYTDYCGQGVRAIAVDAAGNAGDAVLLTPQPGGIASFGEDADHELYVVSQGAGQVYRIDPA